MFVSHFYHLLHRQLIVDSLFPELKRTPQFVRRSTVALVHRRRLPFHSKRLWFPASPSPSRARRGCSTLRSTSRPGSARCACSGTVGASTHFQSDKRPSQRHLGWSPKTNPSLSLMIRFLSLVLSQNDGTHGSVLTAHTGASRADCLSVCLFRCLFLLFSSLSFPCHVSLFLSQ